MKKIYTLEIYEDEKLGYIAHEVTDKIDIKLARVVISYLEEYKQRLISFLLFNQQTMDTKEKEAKKAE